MNPDFLIIGAGIVGLSVARELRARHAGASIVVVDKESELGRHASGRNSGVLHSGIYYDTSTTRFKTCSAGSRELREWAMAAGADIRRVGKLIVPQEEHLAASLESVLLPRAQAAKIPAELVRDGDVRRIEPSCVVDRPCLYLPDAHIVRPASVLEYLRRELESRNVDIRMGRYVHCRDGRAFTGSESYGYGVMVNASGTFADRIAHGFGAGRRYRVIPFKGSYYTLRAGTNIRVNGLIYPVPDPDMPFLGVHFTPSFDGRTIYVGPNASLAGGRENYGGRAGFSLIESARNAGTLARQYATSRQFRSHVHSELLRRRRPAFARSARRLIPDIELADLEPCTKVGIRPQLYDRIEHKLVLDFVIESTGREVHVLNAISPAFTSAFAFARLVADSADALKR